ncbi:AAA family ATPase [Flavobacterium sp. K77]|uniref:ATP-dependent nuclease n=1 Tax=Flavobacterium sp. K77 TaxID=2910676 RepID=UPI001F2F575A|nr:AAA family ATPase [Flavobacterium sp. K77]MCF6142347.1 AAA family ATPase [Flavobacterium sp. K77]
MHINSISIKNFRLLKASTLILNKKERQDLTLLIGKNNSGKTSFIVLFDKFLRSDDFDFHDFPMSLRKKILEINNESDINEFAIELKIEIQYSKDDNLENLSEFIIDLNPKENSVKLLFECSIDKDKLLKDLVSIESDKKNKFVEKYITEYLDKKLYIYSSEDDLLDKDKLVKKAITDIRKIINYQVIHAKRNLASSESSVGNNLPLSRLSSDYFNKENKFSEESFSDINNSILEMDEKLNESYKKHFEGYFSTVNEFLSGASLNVISNIESKQILSNYSKIVYGTDPGSFLPESLNGLGHLNILFLLLQIEVKKKFFEQENKDINLLFIEEPEAHTHPQMQYIFANKIKDIITKIPNLQTFISSHSSHIVSQCDFKDIRYFKRIKDEIKIKNFYNELEAKYSSEPDHFKFLKQYLTLYSSELFFAEKIIFLEGVSEKFLLPYFIKNYDESRKSEKDYMPISSQNISFIEAGANAKVFRHFIEFLNIKTLIITDLDTTAYNHDKKRWKAISVNEGVRTSNITLEYYLNSSSDKSSAQYTEWFTKLKTKMNPTINPSIEVAYQVKQNNYHARSFEDAFISCNLSLIFKYKDDENFLGLKNKDKLVDTRTDYYNLTNEVLDSKSEFASSLLYLSLSKDVKWETPKYILDALKWISE